MRKYERRMRWDWSVTRVVGEERLLGGQDDRQGAEGARHD